MSDERYPIVEKIFLAQPRKKVFHKAMWVARPVVQGEFDEFPRFYNEWLEYSHEPFELYVHISKLDKLQQEITELKQQLESNNGKQNPSGHTEIGPL